MFTFTLVTDQSDYSNAQAHLKFRSYFGDYNQVDLNINLQQTAQEISAIMEDILNYIGDDGYSYIMVSNNRNDKTKMIHNIVDLNFFINETMEYIKLTDDDTPHVGNYWDETFQQQKDAQLAIDAQHAVNSNDAEQLEFIQRMQALQPLVCPYDIDDKSFTRDDYQVNPWLPGVPGIFNSGNAPRSENEINNIEIVNQDVRAKRIAVMDRLASQGAAFPYLSEEALMKDFHKLSAMNEVTDSDLVELIKVGFEGLGKVASGAKDAAKELYSGHKERSKEKAEKKEKEDKDEDEKAIKAEIADATEHVENELSKAKEVNDEHIKQARKVANSVIQLSEPHAEKLKDAVKEKSKELHDEAKKEKEKEDARRNGGS